MLLLHSKQENETKQEQSLRIVSSVNLKVFSFFQTKKQDEEGKETMLDNICRTKEARKHTQTIKSTQKHTRQLVSFLTTH